MSLACDCLICRAVNGEFDSSLQHRAGSECWCVALPADFGKMDATTDPNWVPLDFDRGLPDDIAEIVGSENESTQNGEAQAPHRERGQETL